MMHLSAKQVNAVLRRASVIFWDFDGVIKDSVAVKSAAFEKLFLPFGREIAERVRQHHEAHGGVSRYEKMPLYLSWAGESANATQVQEYCDRFSALVKQAVVDAAWVPGVREYLQAYHSCQRFVLLSATPQKEIEQIVKALDLVYCFCEVHGAPALKASVIRNVVKKWQCPLDQVLVVGDSATDLSAAETNHVPFLLRHTPLNQSLLERYYGPIFEELDYE